MKKIAVVHLVRVHNEITVFERFIDSYKTFPAGIDHNLIILFKGFDPTDDLYQYQIILKHLPHIPFHVPDIGVDITAYVAVMKKFCDRYQYFCFLNSNSELLDRDWLKKMYHHCAKDFVGAVSATGSFESHVNSLENTFAMPSSFIDALKANHFVPFPNPHIRTNAFMMSSANIKKTKWAGVLSKVEAETFESGKHGLSMQLISQSLKILIVGRNGIAYEPEDWDKSKTFRQANQENLLVGDNQTNKYQHADPEMRAFLFNAAWTKKGSRISAHNTADLDIFHNKQGLNHSGNFTKSISIFITSYNYGKYIHDAILSVINQSSPHWQLTILDNGSTDNTREIVQPFLSDKRIQWVQREKNIGSFQNIIQGFREVSGDYIMTLCADDWLEKDFVKNALAGFDEHPDAAYVAQSWRAYSESTLQFFNVTTIPFPDGFSAPVFLSPHLSLGNFIPMHLQVFSKEKICAILDEIEAMPLRQLFDLYILKKLEFRYGTGYFHNVVGGYWRRHSEQITEKHGTNYQTRMEMVLDPLFSFQEDKNPYNKFLSLIMFFHYSVQMPYRATAEWLLCDPGDAFCQRYQIDTKNKAKDFLSVVLTVLMARTGFGCPFIEENELAIWIKDTMEKHDFPTIGSIIQHANPLYDNCLLPDMAASKLPALIEKKFNIAPSLTDSFFVEALWDKNRWLLLPMPLRRQSEKLRVGWTGDSSDVAALTTVYGLIKTLATEVDWVFLGPCPERIRPYLKEWHEAASVDNFPEKLASLHLDLAILPLDSSVDHSKKANNKLLAYGILGYPVIASENDVLPADFPITRVKNRTADWETAIRAYMENPAHCDKMGDTLKQYILNAL